LGYPVMRDIITADRTTSEKILTENDSAGINLHDVLKLYSISFYFPSNDPADQNMPRASA